MPNRGQQLGKRRPFVRRPGIGKFPPWDGMNREGDPAACPPNAFRMLINTRTDDSEIRSRGGQRSLNPEEPMDGCVTGIWPPEYEPPDQTFTRLLISPGYVYAPAEVNELRGIGGPFGEFLYWSGERLLASQLFEGDGQDGALLEYRLTRIDGLTEIDSSNPDYSRIDFDYTTGGTSTVGAPVLHESKYYCPVLDGGVLTLKEIEFGATDWEDADVAPGDVTLFGIPLRWATKTPDGRVIWYADDDAEPDATMLVRDSEGVFTILHFPTDFVPIQGSLTAWCWFNAKLYVAGDDGAGALRIVAFDPVTNTLTSVKDVNLSISDRCSMAVHKGILYFSYETTGGAHRIGTLRAGVWTDSVFSSANPAPIVHMCSFQGYLYVTKGDILFRASNLHATGTLETFYDSEGTDLGVMVAVP